MTLAASIHMLKGMADPAMHDAPHRSLPQCLKKPSFDVLLQLVFSVHCSISCYESIHDIELLASMPKALQRTVPFLEHANALSHDVAETSQHRFMGHDLRLPMLHYHHVAGNTPVISISGIPTVVKWLLNIACLDVREQLCQALRLDSSLLELVGKGSAAPCA